MPEQDDKKKASFNVTNETRHLLNPPAAQRAAYSDRTAWLMCQLSALAYVQFEDGEMEHLETELEKGGFRLLATFNATMTRFATLSAEERKALKEEAKTDTQAILVESNDRTVLAFRGSEANTTDWFATDADARFAELADDDKDGKPDRLHQGFFESYLAVRHDVVRAIKEKSTKELPLFITGHSLGGALATVAAVELEAELKSERPIAAVYTFGSPRVGNPEWAEDLKVPVYRVVNGHDVVAMVPFSGFTGNALARLGLGWLVDFLRKRSKGYIGYQHVGDMRYLTRDGQVKMGSDATITRLMAVFLDVVRVVLRLSWKGITGQLMSFGTDHFIENYNDKLEKWALKRNAGKTEDVR